MSELDYEGEEVGMLTGPDPQPFHAEICNLCSEWTLLGGLTLWDPFFPTGEPDVPGAVLVCWNCVDAIGRFFGWRGNG